MKIRMTMMSGKEKLYFLLNRIDDVREIAPSGQPLKIHPMDDLNGKYRDTELTQLFTKLAKDAQIIKILRVPNRIKTIDFVEGIIPDEPIPENDDGCWHIELLPAFDNYFLKIQQEPEYQEFSGRKPLQPTIQEEIKQAPRIVNEFSPENYPFVLMVLKKIASLTEFSTDNEVNYKLQSPFGQAIIQERSLLKKFEARGLFKHLGEDSVFGIATLSDVDVDLIKQIITKIEEKESGVISEDEFEEIKKKYNQTIQDLHKPNQSSELKERYNKVLGEIRSKSQNPAAFLQEDTQKFNKNDSQLPTSSDDKILECGLLKINLDQSTIQYRDAAPKETTTGINTIKLLIHLMENKRVVEYTEIAQKLKLNCYHEGVTNKDVAREVQFLRRDLGDFLVKIGMSKTEVQELFISKKNVGYKLRCND